MNTKIVGVIGVISLALILTISQQTARSAPALSAQDYAEIHQLYNRYNFGIDTHADDGGMWARTFTADGVFDAGLPSGPLKGFDALKAFAKGNDAGTALTPGHYATNILIEPTPEGAMGSAYFLSVGDSQEGDGLTVASRGVYYDQLVKTAEGWRFKQRTFTSGQFPDALLHALSQ